MLDIKPLVNELFLKKDLELKACAKINSSSEHEKHFEEKVKIEPSVKNYSWSSAKESSIKIDEKIELDVNNLPDFEIELSFEINKNEPMEESDNLFSKYKPFSKKIDFNDDVLHLKKESVLKDDDNEKSGEEDIQILDQKMSCKVDVKVESGLQNKFPYKELFCDQFTKSSTHLKRNIESSLTDVKIAPKEDDCIILEDELSLKGHKKVKSSLENKVLQRSHWKNSIGKVFDCDVCDKKFISADFLKNHLAVHSNANLESQLKTSETIKLNNNAVQTNLRCKICKKSFDSSFNLVNHIESHAKIANIFACKICNKDGIIKKHEEGDCKFKCFICKKGFEHEDALYVHHHLEHETTQPNAEFKKRHKCEVCGVSYKRIRDLKTHMDIHSTTPSEKKHECSVCHKKYNTKKYLSYHMKIHSGKKPWSCEVCNFSFLAKSSLKKHQRTHTGEKPFECSFCNKKFRATSTLTEHLRVHTREKPFSCDICEKAFWRKEHLNEHYIIHTGERPHVCDVCGKVFKYLYKLKLHLKTHAPPEDNKFECEICKRKFKTKLKCKEHMYSHTGEKPYLCTFVGCGKAFSRSAIFSRHLLIHTGKQPYVCEICQRGFNQKTSLTRHYVVHTLEKPYSCEFCEQSFTQKAYLQYHRRKKHSEHMADDESQEIKSKN